MRNTWTLGAAEDPATVAEIGITADMVVKELAKIGFSNIQDYLTDKNGVADLTKIEAKKSASVEKIIKSESSCASLI